MVFDVIGRVGVGGQGREVVLAAFGAQEVADLGVGGENRGGRAELGAHVGNDMPVHRGEPGQPGSVVLDDAVDPASDPVLAQHFQDHVLRRDPWRQLPGQAHPPDLGHPDPQRLAGDR